MREYIEDSGQSIDLGDTVSAYTSEIIAFDRWTAELFVKGHLEAIESFPDAARKYQRGYMTWGSTATPRRRDSRTAQRRWRRRPRRRIAGAGGGGGGAISLEHGQASPTSRPSLVRFDSPSRQREVLYDRCAPTHATAKVAQPGGQRTGQSAEHRHRDPQPADHFPNGKVFSWPLGRKDEQSPAAFPLVRAYVVGATGFEPVTSSVSGKSG